MMNKTKSSKLGKKIDSIGKAAVREAVTGAHFARAKVSEIEAERQKALSTQELGNKAYALYKTGKLAHKPLVSLCKKIEKLEKASRAYAAAASQALKKL